MAAQDHSVLIVDDDNAVRDLIARHLNQQGYDVIVGSSADDAHRLALDSYPDAVFCDVHISNDAGEPLLQVLARDPGIAPIIALSDGNRTDDVLGALRLGAGDYFNTADLDLDVLNLSTARAVEQGALRRENREYRKRLEQINSDLEASLKLLRQDQQAGRHVQLKMLPPAKKAFDDYQFSHHIVPSLLLSGDFIDYFTVGDHHLVFFIADVSGHGASSAFVTVLLKNLFARKRSDFVHRRDEVVRSPAQMLSRANAELLNTQIGKHVTMCVGVIDQRDNSLCYSVAGHLPLPVLTTAGKARYLEGEGMPVGLFEDASYNEQRISLPDDFELALFTDGILETLGVDGVIAQEQVLLARIAETGLGSIEKICTTLGVDKVEEAPDDIAVLLISKVSR